MISHKDLREAFASFWKGKNHREIPPASLVLKEDATTLFTSAGMQPLIPYLAGESHPMGKRLFDIQPCFRAVDINEVGDNRHTTLYEMMGNWSLGDYFKQEQLKWCFEFLTSEISLPKEKLYVTAFEGNNDVPKDEESALIWKALGIPDNHIFFYSAEKNWWSRTGVPETMPVGEIGGPSSEVFFEFSEVKHDLKFGKECHPNCDCGRFLEICNSVFIQYRKKNDGTLEELPQKNVDFGGGLERILMATHDDPDIFNIDVFSSIIRIIEEQTGRQYEGENKEKMRIIADHMKGATFLAADGVVPSNKMQGYMLRRLIRRSAVKLHQLKNETVNLNELVVISEVVFGIYKDIYFQKNKKEDISAIISDEITRFNTSLQKGLQLINQLQYFDAKTAFDLYQNHGFPLELTCELAEEKGQKIIISEFKAEFRQHQKLSRSTSAGMFKGGLADHSEQVIKYHTATHLLHQTLRDVLGTSVRQEGSNITGERLRFDFSFDRKPTEEEIKNVEDMINNQIQEALPVHFEIMKQKDAEKSGALFFFKEKYGEEVKVYFVGDYSKEFCGGPHVENTKEIGTISIFKVEKIGTNLIRVYAK